MTTQFFKWDLANKDREQSSPTSQISTPWTALALLIDFLPDQLRSVKFDDKLENKINRHGTFFLPN